MGYATGAVRSATRAAKWSARSGRLAQVKAYATGLMHGAQMHAKGAATKAAGWDSRASAWAGGHASRGVGLAKRHKTRTALIIVGAGGTGAGIYAGRRKRRRR